MVAGSGWSPDWEVSAWTPDGVIMAIRHLHQPVVGVQFHPESILTDYGYTLICNFLQMADIAVPPTIDEAALSGRERPGQTQPVVSFRQPVTF